MDDALAGTRVLIAGGEPDDAKALGASLAAAAAQGTVAPDAEAAAQAALAARPDVIVAIGSAEAELRDLLDPLELRSGPPLLGAAVSLAASPFKRKQAPHAGPTGMKLEREAVDKLAREVLELIQPQLVQVRGGRHFVQHELVEGVAPLLR